MPEGWFEVLDLESLARPLARHPDFPGGASIHVVHLPGGDSFRIRSYGFPAPDLVTRVLERTSHIQIWNQAD
jgi:hypothetical protein